MRLLIAIDSFYDGGAEMFAIRLANALKNGGVSVVFMELRSNNSLVKAHRSLLSSEIELFQPDAMWPLETIISLLNRVSNKRICNLLRKIFLLIKVTLIRNILRKHRIDLVHSNSFESDQYFTDYKENHRLRFLLSSFHGHYENKRIQNKVRNYEDVVSQMLKRIDYIVYTSTNHVKSLNEFDYPLEKRSKIYYGHESAFTRSRTKYDNRDELKICIVSRAIKEKGWEPFIEAVNVINASKRIVKLTLVGDGPDLEYFKNKYKETGSINFHGFKNDPTPFIADSHVCALVSNYAAESMPNSVIEYLCQGKPVLASDAGDISNMITYEGSQAGIICPLRNGLVDINDIIDGIKIYISNPDLVEEHSKLAMKAYEKFSMVRCLEKYQTLYESILNTRCE